MQMLRKCSSFQSKKALKSILQKCTYLPALEPLLYDAPSNILKHIICQFSKVRTQAEAETNMFQIILRQYFIKPCPALKRCCLMTARPGVCS